MEPDQQFLSDIVSQLVDKPDKVEVDRRVDELGVLLTVRVAKPDLGKVIGKGGQTANALRLIMRVYGARNDAHVNVKVDG